MERGWIPSLFNLGLGFMVREWKRKSISSFKQKRVTSWCLGLPSAARYKSHQTSVFCLSVYLSVWQWAAWPCRHASSCVWRSGIFGSKEKFTARMLTVYNVGSFSCHAFWYLPQRFLSSVWRHISLSRSPFFHPSVLSVTAVNMLSFLLCVLSSDVWSKPMWRGSWTCDILIYN